MSERKASMGYSTPSKEIQDVFAMVEEKLSRTSADWDAINRRATQILTKRIKDNLKGGDLITLGIVIVVEVSKLGKELAETHKRLAKVEVSLKEIHRKL